MAKWQQQRSFWTWGYTSDEPSQEERNKVAAAISKRAGRELTPPPIPTIDEIELSPSRVSVPAQLGDWVTADHAERVTHTYGGHPLELLAAMRGKFEAPPDAVAHPRNDAELEATLGLVRPERLCRHPLWRRHHGGLGCIDSGRI